MSTIAIRSLQEAVEFFRDTLGQHPEREQVPAYQAILDGRPRRYPVIYLNHLNDPSDTFIPQDELELPKVEMSDSPEAKLARELIGNLEPLKMLNPVSRSFSLGVGPGSLCPSFGQRLNPEAQWTPPESRTMDEVIDMGVPNPETSGMLPEMRAKIDLIKATTPPEFRIHLPDRQGPFNLAHLILGNEAFTAPYLEPEKYHACMQIITDFWIKVRQVLIRWVGPERMYPWYWSNNIICECSCNLISPATYEEFVLPYDLQIVQAIGKVAIHPCSGPHVFRETLQHLSTVEYTEAGSIEKTAAGAMKVEEALAAIGSRDIALGIGQEPPAGREFESVCAHLDLYPAHPRMSFSYTIMHMGKKDRPLIRDIHRRLDEYWDQSILPKLGL